MPMRTIQLTGEPLEIQAAASDNVTTFRELLYGGGVITLQGFGELVIALNNLEIPGRISLLIDHENRLSAVAGSGRAYVEDGKLWIEGQIARDTPAGEMVVRLAESGVPLQMSVGARALEAKQLRAGQRFYENGRQHVAGTNGLRHITRSICKE